MCQDTKAGYFIRGSSSQSYRLEYLPSPGAPIVWISGLSSIEEAKEQLGDCKDFLHRLMDRLASGDSVVRCSRCDGRGKVVCPSCNMQGRPYDCPNCSDYSGSWGTVDCVTCGSSGIVTPS